MAINFIRQPQTLTAGYNPVYVYASATTLNEQSFSYVVNVQKDDNGVWQDLYTGTVKPRLGDGLLEMNVNKILQSGLKGIHEYIDINTNTNLFTNNNDSSYRYRIRVAEQFRKRFNFISVGSGTTGNLTLYTLEQPNGVSQGDSIRVSGIAEEYAYNSITEGVNGFAQINFVNSGNNFQTGDNINISQNTPFAYPVYNQQTTVLIADPDYVVVNLLWAGASSVPQTGKAIRNRQWDVTHQVTNVFQTVITFPGPIFVPVWGVTTSTPIDTVNNLIPFPTGATGNFVFSDSRLTTGGLTTFGVRKVYNGILDYDVWVNKNMGDYLDFSNTIYKPLISDLPQTLCLNLDDDIFFTIDGALSNIGGFIPNRRLLINTYDTNNNLIDTITLLNPNTAIQGIYESYSQVLNISPDIINLNLPQIQILDNCEFTGTTNWVITNTGNASTSITGGELVYQDDDEFGGSGQTTTVQANALVVGQTYTTTLVVNNNLECTIQISDGVTVHQTVNLNQSGTFTFTFVADGTDFTIIITGVGDTTHGAEIASVCTTTPPEPLITCNTKKIGIQLLRNNGNPHSEELFFNICCKCNQRYTSYTLLFEDNFGALIPLHFDLNHKRELNIQREHTRKHIGGLQTTGVNPFGYSVADHSKRTYSVLADEEWELNTDWMDEEMSIYFTQLIMSNNVWIKVNGVYYSVNIIDRRHEILRKNNEKNIRYTLTVQFSLRNGKTQ